ncbi:MAG: NADP-dependent glyceraldehyde-3-phosphate dehydrogenase [Candidatus Hydrogenedentes bacterium]|nr:NADP-dependent glyceraldehyde-3-phosphate dehydrogenase [Candidatus Hydrogenedentota bacterium]
MTVSMKAGHPFPEESAIPESMRAAIPLEQRDYLINGEIRTWKGPVQEVFSPVCAARDGALEPVRLGHYPLLTEHEALEALDAAASAYGHGRGAWPMMTVSERIACLEDFLGRMAEQRERTVALLMWEIAKNRADAAKEFDRTLVYIRDTIAAYKDLDRAASRFEIEEGVIAQIRRAPLGVVLCMGPYNYPLNETFTTLIPALLMGNTVIFKPPKLGVLLHRPLLEAFQQAFPPGVVNTVYGDGREVCGPLMASGRVDCLAFIGSSRVAGILKSQHPKPHRLRCVLGLEAKNPAIVLADADLDLAVRECALGALSYNGQRCTALKILFVHRSIVDAFLARLSEAVGALRLGMPWEDGAQLTPLADPDQAPYLESLVRDAIEKGAAVVNAGGGQRAATCLTPAILYPAAPGMRVYAEEQFGPVVPVVAFDDLEEPLRYVVDSPYGQQAAVFGSDPEAVARLLDVLANQVCRVNLNSQCQRGPDTFPFTGRKDSAEGTLSVSDALRVFSIRTLVAAKEGALNKRIINGIVRERHSGFLSTDFIF